MKAFLSSKAYPWTYDNDFYFRGYFIVDEKCFRGNDAISYLKSQLLQEDCSEVFCRLNGSFSLIWAREDSILFAVDRLRGLPLFYAVVDGDLWIGDDASALTQALPCGTIDPISREEYLSSGLFVSGKYTLLENLFQVQASNYCTFEKRSLTVTENQYYHVDHIPNSEDLAARIDKFHQAYHQAGSHLVQALSGRTAIVPLSGGADSRMVLSMLKEAGYQKVLCFTYGQPGNHEAEISRKVAAEYGYEWVFVPYTAKLWKKTRNDPATKDYFRLASAFVSTPHIQDFLAVKCMKEQGKLPDDGVFVPGHSGDMIAGSHITPDFLQNELSRKDFLKTITDKFYSKSLSQAALNRIFPHFPACDISEMEQMASQSEWFNVQERQAKFIVNSVRVYEFFGHEWLIPLWDNALFAFWKEVPLELRYNRKLYFRAVNNTLPSTNDKTVGKAVASQLRSIPGIRTLARRVARLKRYWNSPLRLECLFSFGTYMRACFFEFPTFTVNNLLAQEMIDCMQRELNDEKK